MIPILITIIGVFLAAIGFTMWCLCAASSKYNRLQEQMEEEKRCKNKY